MRGKKRKGKELRKEKDELDDTYWYKNNEKTVFAQFLCRDG